MLAGLVLLKPFSLVAAVPVQIGKNFVGASYGVDSSALPPDANGAIGPQHFVELINGRFSVFDKVTGQKVQTMSDLSFWKAGGIFLPSNFYVSDPRIVFDPSTQRWFASCIDLDPSDTTSNRFLLAVSASANPTGSWNGMAFTVDPDTGLFGDFPTLGIDDRAVYLGADLFNAAGANVGGTIVTIPKLPLLGSPPDIAGLTRSGVLDYTTHGEILQPVVTRGVATSDEVVLAVSALGTDFKPHSSLVGFTVENAGVPGAASLGIPTSITIPEYNVPINPPQPNGRSTLDDGDARISSTASRVGDVIYAVHGTQVDSRAALQWFKINATNLTVIQTGTITDTNLHLFFPSIAANAFGNVVIAFNGCSAKIYLGSYAVVGETREGTLTFNDRLLLKAGTVSYQNLDGSGSSRWGDYSATTVDPLDPNHFWTIQIFPSNRTAWSTQITELIIVPPALTIAASAGNLQISWPGTATGYQLQHATGFSSAANWLPLTGNLATNSGRFSVTLPLGTTQEFYRLARP